MKVLYVAENDGLVPEAYAKSSDRLMRETGDNVGNLAFWYAARRLIAADIELVSLGASAHEVDADAHALIIPAANFLNPNQELTSLAGLVRQLDRPVVLLGIGAQARTYEEIPELRPSVVEFLHEVSRRTPFIAVRGEHTAMVCRSYGITNVRVLGCPSLMISGARNLGEVIERRTGELRLTSVAVHAACVKGDITSLERELCHLMTVYPGSTWVVQRPVELIKHRQREALGAEERAYFEKCRGFFGLEGRGQTLETFLDRYGYVPTSVESWIAYLQGFSASINTRIHGTIMALAAGVPALCIHHDTRTRELCERMLVPTMAPQEFVALRHDPAAALRSRVIEGKAFDENRRETANEYVTLFRACGIPASDHLLRLAA